VPAIGAALLVLLSVGALQAAEPPPTLPAGTPHHVTVKPGTPVAFRLEPSGAFIEVDVTFEGAEVVATLQAGNAAPVSARLPERTQGRMTVHAETAATGARQDTTLTLEVLRDYARDAQVDVKWNSGTPDAASRERAAVQTEIYTAIGEWWNGSRQTRESAAARLTKVLDRLRTPKSPILLYDALIVLSAVHIDLGNREPALAAAAEAAELARASGDESNEALAIQRTSVARGITGELEAAGGLSRQVIAIRQRLNGGKGDPRGEADALINLAGVLSSRAATDEALAALERAQPLAETAGDLRLQGAVFNQRAVIYGQTGRTPQAIENYERALTLRRQVGDRIGIGQTLSNLGVAARDSGDVRRAIDLLEEALVLRRATGNAQGVANTLYNLGNANLDLGRFQRAIDLMTESLAIWRETKGLRGEAFTTQNLGQAAARLGDPVKARAYYEQALALWQRVGDRRGEAIVGNHLAGNALTRGEFDEAATWVEKSLASAKAANARREQADTLIVGGMLLRKKSDLAGSEARLREAIEIDDAIKNRIGASNARTELGLTLEAAGRFAEARTALDAALAAREEIGDRRGQVAALIGLARLDRQAGALDAAQTRAMRAVDLVEQLRVGLLSTRARLTLGVTAQGVYELARDILIDRHLQAPAAGYDQAALAVQERARARSLLEALTNGGTAVPAGDEASLALIARQRDLEADLEVQTARLGRLVDAGQPAAVTAARAELSALVLSLDEVKADLRKRSPAYAALTQLAPPPLLTAEALRPLLDDGTALFEIALGDTRSVGWLMTSKGVRTVILPARASIEQAAQALVASMTARNQFPDGESRAARQTRVAAADRQWSRDAAKLASLVLAPFGTVAARRVAFVADGALAGVPFAALPVTARAGTLDFARACGPVAASCVLGGHADVIALPSASILAELRNRAKVPDTPATVRALVLADPVFRVDDPRAVSARRTSGPAPEVVASASAAADAKKSKPRASGSSESGEQGASSGDPRAVSARRASGPAAEVAASASPGAAEATKDAPTPSGGASNEPHDGGARDAAPQSLHTLPRLPYSREEAEAIATLAGRDRVVLGLDFEATRDQLTKPRVAAPEVLHIATHALIDDAQPELSGIVLSLVDARGQPTRGFLPLVEVYDLPVRARLVVLSACRTAAGPDVPGEGLASLTRGFMYAGSARVVASLWSVEDRATTVFMRAFYDALFARGLPAPAALRAAQAELRRTPRWASPYYWAAFTFQGDWR
jgi:tetratricopeptide (TPR) repeat protein